MLSDFCALLDKDSVEAFPLSKCLFADETVLVATELLAGVAIDGKRAKVVLTIANKAKHNALRNTNPRALKQTLKTFLLNIESITNAMPLLQRGSAYCSPSPTQMLSIYF